MDILSIYNNIKETIYNVSKNKIECIVELKDGQKLYAEKTFEYKTSVFGYDIIDPLDKASCLESAINNHIANLTA